MIDCPQCCLLLTGGFIGYLIYKKKILKNLFDPTPSSLDDFDVKVSKTKVIPSLA